MKQLIEDYERKLKAILEMIKNADTKGVNYVRLNTKAICFRHFLKELNRALNIDGVIKRYTFDCWYLNDGISSKKYIEAKDTIEAIKIFEFDNPMMGHDYPYE